MRRGSARDSIQWKYPVLLGLLLLLVVASLTWISAREVERALLGSAEARVAAAAGLLAEALEPGLRGWRDSTAALAASPELAAFLDDPSPPARERLVERVESTLSASAMLVARSAEGTCLLVVTGAGEVVEEDPCVGLGPPVTGSGGATIGALRRVDGSAAVEVSAPVPVADGSSSSPSAAGGSVVVLRRFTESAGVALIEGLIGGEARVYLVDREAGAATDLAGRMVTVPAGEYGAGLARYRSDDGDHLGVAVPLEDSPLTLWVGLPRAAALAPLGGYLTRSGLAALAVLVIGCAGAWAVTHRIVVPLGEATRAAEHIAAGDYSRRVEVDRGDEIGRMAAAFNRMADEVDRHNRELEDRVAERTGELQEALARLKEAQAELVRQEKLATLGHLASGVGHELRNPLGVMSNAIYYLRMVLPDAGETVHEYLGILSAQVGLSEKIVSDLLDFARVKPPQREAVRPADLVREQLDRVTVPPGVTVAVDVPPDLPPLLVDRVQVGQVLLNLLTNGIQAMEDGGTLTVAAADGTEGALRIDVTDSGAGIPPDQLERIFEPLFTTRARGIGLGLSVARSLATANDGELTVISEPGRGSTFSLVLPTTGDGR